MTVQLICLCDVYTIDVFTNSINLIWHYWKADLMETVKSWLLFNGGYSTFVYHRWSICISRLKAADKGLSEKRRAEWKAITITLITQGQAFKFDNSSFFNPSYQIREKGETFYNAFAHKWISPWRMFPSSRECIFQSSCAFYDISNDLCDITVKIVILDDLVMEFEVKVRLLYHRFTPRLRWNW